MAEQARWCLVVGAQKAGSATLHRDLQLCSGVAVPDTKEVGWFNDDRILEPKRRKKFDDAYRLASPTDLRVDVSTSYFQRTEFSGVPSRVRDCLGSDVMIVASLRDPVDRLLSHHRHEASLGLQPSDLAEAVRTTPRLLSNSRYNLQLSAWAAEFGWENLVIVDFERYVAGRQETIAELAETLSFVAPATEASAMSEVHNKTVGRHTPTGVYGRLVLSAPYQKLKRFVPASIRARVQTATTSQAEPLPPPNDRQLGQITEQLCADVAELAITLDAAGKTRPEWINNYLTSPTQKLMAQPSKEEGQK